MVGRASRAAAGPGRLSAHAAQNSDLGRGRRQSAIGDSRRLAQPADGARHHRRHAGALRAVRQSVPPGGGPAGHDAEKLPVGINTHGFVGDTSQQAADEFFPSYAAQMTHIGRERGWPPTSREQFDAGRSPKGHLAVGSPQEVIDKILRQHEALGHSRYLMQMSVGTMPHAKLMRSIELLGHPGRARRAEGAEESLGPRRPPAGAPTPSRL